MDRPNRSRGDDAPTPRGYDRVTLIVAGLIFVGFCLLVFFLPAIMAAIGGDNPWAAGLAIAAVLVLPFGGLWLRGRIQRARRNLNTD